MKISLVRLVKNLAMKVKTSVKFVGIILTFFQGYLLKGTKTKTQCACKTSDCAEGPIWKQNTSHCVRNVLSRETEGGRPKKDSNKKQVVNERIDQFINSIFGAWNSHLFFHMLILIKSFFKRPLIIFYIKSFYARTSWIIQIPELTNFWEFSEHIHK